MPRARQWTQTIGDFGATLSRVDRRAAFRSLQPGFMAATVVCALIIAPAFGWLAENLVDERAARAAVIEDADRAAREELIGLGFVPLRPTHGVELLAAQRAFSLELGNGAVSGSPAGSLEPAARIVSEELGRYPRELLVAARLRRVIFVRDLREADVPIPSLPNLQRSLLLDVDAPEPFLRRLVHHELFHFADYADDEQVQRDPDWARLNDRWFVYGSGGRFARDPRASRPNETLPGFVTAYAQSALEEDKAETFSFFMSDRPWLEARAEADPVIRAKLARVQGQLVALSPSAAGLFAGR